MEQGSLPKRKPTRLKEYDYSTPGAYFITVCVKDKKQILGKIVGDGIYDVPQMRLTGTGKILEKYIKLMGEKYSHISIDKYIIMPNHIHLILRITKIINKDYGTSQAPSPTNNEISKFISLLKRYCNMETGQSIWQRSYHDHIIRGDRDYKLIWEYIDTNVLRWKKDCFYTEDE